MKSKVFYKQAKARIRNALRSELTPETENQLLLCNLLTMQAQSLHLDSLNRVESAVRKLS